MRPSEAEGNAGYGRLLLSAVMSRVILFHHALGLTTGVQAFAEELRAVGHTVLLPDLFDGSTFTTLGEGVAHIDSIGIEVLLDRGVSAATDNSSGTVFAGLSLGALVAHKLAQTRPNARGALLYHYGDVPMTAFGEAWPATVPVEFHIAERDEWRGSGVAEKFVAEVKSVASAKLFNYPGSAHLFTEPTSTDFDPVSTELVLQRTKAFLARLN
jgi:dienelactone hydrolase